MKSLFSILLLLCSLAAHAEAPFRPVPGNLFSAVRSNVPHFWNWLRQQNSQMLQVQGVVVGDAHILNFGDVELASGGRELALIDVDDSGEGSLVGDFVRFAVSNQASPYQVDVKDLIEAYKTGLRGNDFDKPHVLKKAENQSNDDFDQRQAKYIDKMTSHGKFNDNAKLVAVGSAPSDVQNVFQAASATFAAQMAGYNILDIGYKTHDSGGSQGLPRFWYLIEKSGHRFIVEFKQETTPATAQYRQQRDIADRFTLVSSIYRPGQKAYGPYKIVKVGAAAFLMRARLAPFLNFDPEKNTSNDDIQDGQEMSVYLAYRMGLWQSQQDSSQGLAQAISKSEIIDLVQSYFTLIQDLNH